MQCCGVLNIRQPFKLILDASIILSIFIAISMLVYYTLSFPYNLILVTMCLLYIALPLHNIIEEYYVVKDQNDEAE